MIRLKNYFFALPFCLTFGAMFGVISVFPSLSLATHGGESTTCSPAAPEEFPLIPIEKQFTDVEAIIKSPGVDLSQYTSKNASDLATFLFPHLIQILPKKDPHGTPYVYKKSDLTRYLKTRFFPFINQHRHPLPPGPLYQSIVPRPLSAHLPEGFFLLPDGKVIIDWPKVIIGKGGSKTVYFSVDLDAALKKEAVGLKASWDGDHAPDVKKELEIEERVFGKDNETIYFSSPKLSTTGNQSGLNSSTSLSSTIGIFTAFSTNSSSTPTSSTRPSLHVIQPYFNRGTLANLNPKIGKEVETKVLLPIVRALFQQFGELHDANFVHLDVKKENILLNQDENGLSVRLIDFGSALKLSESLDRDVNEAIDGRVQNMHGSTPSYLPPERASRKLGLPSLNMNRLENFGKLKKWHEHIKKGDVWALGLSLYSAKTNTREHGCIDETLPKPTNLEELVRFHTTSFMNIAKIKNYDDLCVYCKIFCNPVDTTKGKEPLPNTLDHLIYEMLNPDVDQRPDFNILNAKIKTLPNSD